MHVANTVTVSDATRCCLDVIVVTVFAVVFAKRCDTVAVVLHSTRYYIYLLI